MRSTQMLVPEQHLTVREAAVVLLAALEARGAVFWLDDDECMCCDLATAVSTSTSTPKDSACYATRSDNCSASADCAT